VTAGVIAVAVALAGVGSDWLAREAAHHSYNSAVLAFMLRQPGFASGREPIAFAPQTLATLAGPRLRHPLALIGAAEPCAQVRARLRHGWIVLQPEG
jgi:hypothetical protein